MKWFFNLSKWKKRIICTIPLALCFILLLANQLLLGAIFLILSIPFIFLLERAERLEKKANEVSKNSSSPANSMPLYKHLTFNLVETCNPRTYRAIYWHDGKFQRLIPQVYTIEVNDGHFDFLVNNEKLGEIPSKNFDEVNKIFPYIAKIELEIEHDTELEDNDYSPVVSIIYFKNMKVTEIGAADILKFQAHLNSLNLSTSYKSSIRSVLNHFFSYLKIHNIQNPVKLVKGFKKNREQKREIQFWTEQEFKIFIKSVDDKRFYAVFSFLYLTGCRKGEALALQWKDVDIENKNVKIKTTISKATDKTRTVNDGIKLDSQYRITTPKTENSYRTILLPLNLVGILKNLKENASETDFVFGNENKIMSFNTLQNAFKRYIKRSGVKDIRIHDLRHSHVSLLINKGSNQLATLYIIAARLGDTVDMILKTYGHLFPNNQTEIICKLNIDF